MLDIIILAAGKGTRMKSELPKVLHPIGGKPFLSHVISSAQSLGENRVHVIIGHGGELVKTTIGSDSINFVEQTEQLGTGHAVQQILPHINNDSVSLILYGDVPLITSATLENLISKVQNNTLGLLTVTLDNPQGYGRIVRDENNAVTSIVEQKDASAEQLTIQEINTGIMAVNTSDLQKWLPALSNNNAQGEYYLTDIIAMAVADNVEVITAQPSDEWEVMGVNNRLQQAELERIHQANLAQQLMIDGVTLLDPNRFDCRGELTCGNDVVIDINCVFEGKVELGNGVIIGPNCSLKNTVVGDNTVIKANSVLEDAETGSQCDVGPFARLRPGTVLGNKAKIGNFVETKKAIVGDGSKVNHLSYVGDSELGKDVNIGAGTITCNYDGFDKFTSEIGGKAFIGSNSSLVAPVIIGEGAIIGASTTVLSDVPKDAIRINNKSERSLPFILTIIYYGMAYYILITKIGLVYLPIVIYSAFSGCIVSIFLVLLINTKFKISAHCVGVSGVLGAFLGACNLYFNLNSSELTTYGIVLILICGITASTRLWLKAHTQAQVYLGLILGFCIEYVFVSFNWYIQPLSNIFFN